MKYEYSIMWLFKKRTTKTTPPRQTQQLLKHDGGGGTGGSGSHNSRSTPTTTTTTTTICCCRKRFSFIVTSFLLFGFIFITMIMMTITTTSITSMTNLFFPTISLSSSSYNNYNSNTIPTDLNILQIQENTIVTTNTHHTTTTIHNNDNMNEMNQERKELGVAVVDNSVIVVPNTKDLDNSVNVPKTIDSDLSQQQQQLQQQSLLRSVQQQQVVVVVDHNHTNEKNNHDTISTTTNIPEDDDDDEGFMKYNDLEKNETTIIRTTPEDIHLQYEQLGGSSSSSTTTMMNMNSTTTTATMKDDNDAENGNKTTTTTLTTAMIGNLIDTTDDDDDNDNPTIRSPEKIHTLYEKFGTQQQQESEKEEETKTDDNDSNDEQDDNNNDDNDDPDIDCPFRNSPLYRKIYVYPSPYETEHWHGSILSEAGRSYNNTNHDTTSRTSSTFAVWPWLIYDKQSRTESTGHYNIHSNQNIQYTTELLVRELMINSKSCLRSYDPDSADLFYVPYLPSMEHHMGHDKKTNYTTSVYGQAIEKIITQQHYDDWELYFGFTSKYWKQRNGSDHILVFSEPLHGLSHPRNKRGHYHYIHTQYQLQSPIIISVELSTTFIQMYPQCTKKNILVPYPNTVGSWYNGIDNQRTIQTLITTIVEEGLNDTLSTNKDTTTTTTRILTALTSPAALPEEKKLQEEQQQNQKQSSQQLYHTLADFDDIMNHNNDTATSISLPITFPRPIGQYYAVGLHGTCKALRKALKNDYTACSPSNQFLVSSTKENTVLSTNAKENSIGMRMSTFCPCPGGDSPGAKRMFDAILAGCIPVILSYDFVWPFSTEFDITTTSNSLPITNTTTSTSTMNTKSLQLLDPNDFSIRLNAKDYEESALDSQSCLPTDTLRPGLQAYLESIPSSEIERLRTNVQYVAEQYYGWYSPKKDLPMNPLQDGILPDGGLAHQVVQALVERSRGQLWPECYHELQQQQNERERNGILKQDEPNRFVC